MAIHKRFTGDAADLERALDQVNRKYAEMDRRLAQVQQRSSRTQEQTQTGLGATIGFAGRASAAVAAISAAWNTVTNALSTYAAELERVEALQERALDRAGQIAPTQETLIQNLGVEGSRQRRQIAERLSDELHQPIGDVIDIMTQVASQAGGLGVEEQAAAAGVGIGLSPSDMARAATFAGSALQTQNVLGQGTTSQQALGLLLSAQGVSAITSPTTAATRMGPIIATAGEIDPQSRLRASREALAMFSMMTQVTGPEASGEAATSTIGLMGRLATFFRAEGREDPGTLFGRVQALQADPQLREQFAPQAREITGISTTLQATARAILTDPEAMRFGQAQQFFGAITPDPTLVEAQIEEMRTGTPELRAQARRRELQYLRERQERDPGLQIREAIEQAGDIIRDERSQTAIGRFGNFFDAFGGGINATLGVRRSTLSQAHRFRLMAENELSRIGDPENDADAARAERLQTQYDMLSDIINVLREGNAGANANAQFDRHQE